MRVKITQRRFHNQFAVPHRPPSGAPLEEKCAWMRARQAAKEAEQILKCYDALQVKAQAGELVK